MWKMRLLERTWYSLPCSEAPKAHLSTGTELKVVFFFPFQFSIIVVIPRLKVLEAAASVIVSAVKKAVIVVEKSTVAGVTVGAMRDVFAKHPELQVDLICNPEFLSEGSAVENLMRPDRVLIGGDASSERNLRAQQTLVELYAQYERNKTREDDEF